MQGREKILHPWPAKREREVFYQQANFITEQTHIGTKGEMCPILQTILANLKEVVTCEFGKTTEIVRGARIIY